MQASPSSRLCLQICTCMWLFTTPVCTMQEEMRDARKEADEATKRAETAEYELGVLDEKLQDLQEREQVLSTRNLLQCQWVRKQRSGCSRLPMRASVTQKNSLSRVWERQRRVIQDWTCSHSILLLRQHVPKCSRNRSSS